MALEIIDKKIVGTIDKLDTKLDGKLPVDRLELLYLINSWGRSNSFQTSVSNYNQIEIKACEPLECYNLSKLDVSKITNMERLFMYSNFTDIYSTNRIGFHNNIHSSNGVGLHNDIHSTNGIGLHNGDISNWNTSNVTDMNEMFYYAKKFNQDISKWDVSKVTNMNLIFSNTEEFNQPLNSWDVSNVINMFHIFGETKKFNQDISDWNLNDIVYFEDAFYKAEAFLNKYNNGEILPNNSNELKNWFKENREKINNINFKDKHGEEIDMFFNKFTDINFIQKKEIKWH